MDNYKNHINKINLASSDRKKLLALPFSASLRRQLPEPKRGMDEWEIFEEWSGKPWDAYASQIFDEEKKVTEFDYEKFIPKVILDQYPDKESVEFKNFIRKKNFFTFTEYEQHKA